MVGADVPRFCGNEDCLYHRVLHVAHVGPCYDNRATSRLKAEDTRRRYEDRVVDALKYPEPMWEPMRNDRG